MQCWSYLYLRLGKQLSLASTHLSVQLNVGLLEDEFPTNLRPVVNVYMDQSAHSTSCL